MAREKIFLKTIKIFFSFFFIDVNVSNIFTLAGAKKNFFIAKKNQIMSLLVSIIGAFTLYYEIVIIIIKYLLYQIIQAETWSEI